MKALLTPPDQFARYKDRATEYINLALPKCDPELVELITAFNRAEGLAPIYSCAGHYLDPQYGDSLYIMFSVNEHGAELLSDLLVAVKKRLVTTEAYDIAIRLVYRVDPTFEWVRGALDYPAWIFCFQYSFDEESDNTIRNEADFERTKLSIISIISDELKALMA